jgi:hypothetical protein
MKNKLTGLLFAFFLTCTSYPQADLSVGAYAGGGAISANSPNEGAFSSSVFIEAYLSPFDYLSTRLSFIYATDFNSLVPESSNQYYPSVKGISLKGVYSYYLNYNFYIEQGLGLVTLNDRIYSDRNNWDYGVILSLLAGIDLRQVTINGFRMGLGMEYGLTFFNYSIQYYSVHFLVQYLF